MSGVVPATRFTQPLDLEMQFPPLPRTVAAVAELLADEGAPDLRRLAEVVNMDPVVAGAVLRRINSAYYGLRHRIGSIEKAVFLLGFLEVCNIVLTSSLVKLRSVLHSEEQEDIFEKIMELSIGAAFYTQAIAQRVDLPQQGLAFTAGLLHAAGRLVLLYNRPNDYEALWWTSQSEGVPSAADEQLIFGTDHAALGGRATMHWQLPVELCRVVEQYLEPEAIDDPAQRRLAQALAAGTAVTLQQHGLAARPDQEAFEMPETLIALAEAQGVNPTELAEQIAAIQDQAARFIAGMQEG